MNTINLQSIIPEELHQSRLDRALATVFNDYSRSQLQQWIKDGGVTVNGEVCQEVKRKVATGDAIDIHATLAPQANWQAQAIDLDIIYQDDDLIIINKPPGLVVHPGAGNPDKTLVNALIHFDPELDKVPRAGIIHRLDKDTSGLLVIARNLAAHNHLVQAMEQREIKRQYQALVHGEIIAGDTIDAPMARHPKYRTKMAVVNSGKPAVTHYRVLQKFPNKTLLQVELESGRTHQIRVHMLHINHPVVGDQLYQLPKYHQANKIFHRQALHAFKLGLVHPATNEWVEFKAPLPEDMAALLEN